jgi:hypothetical protein
METNERFIVIEIIKFGMLFGYSVYDRQEKEELPYEFSCEEFHKAKSKAELNNVLSKI